MGTSAPCNQQSIIEEAQIYDRERLVLLSKAVEEFMAGRMTQEELDEAKELMNQQGRTVTKGG